MQTHTPDPSTAQPFIQMLYRLPIYTDPRPDPAFMHTSDQNLINTDPRPDPTLIQTPDQTLMNTDHRPLLQRLYTPTNTAQILLKYCSDPLYPAQITFRPQTQILQTDKESTNVGGFRGGKRVNVLADTTDQHYR